MHTKATLRDKRAFYENPTVQKFTIFANAVLSKNVRGFVLGRERHVRSFPITMPATDAKQPPKG